jgi:hypothetical protein
MKYSDDVLMAYADGELDTATRAEIERAIARDPGLARAVERHRAMAARIRGAYAGVLDEPVPERLAALAAQSRAAPVADLATKRSQRLGDTARWRLPQWAALAATVVAAVFVGLLVLRGPSPPYEEVGGMRVARGTLAEALTTELASRPGASGVSIGISFRDRAGAYCRTFHLQQDDPVAGLACRSGEDWQLRVLAEAPAQDGELRAAEAMPLAVLQAVDAAIDGEPLDAAAEAAARDAGWRKDGNMAE